MAHPVHALKGLTPVPFNSHSLAPGPGALGGWGVSPCEEARHKNKNRHFVFDWDCSGYEPAVQWVVSRSKQAITSEHGGAMAVDRKSFGQRPFGSSSAQIVAS
jgi:hypothetical protein